MSKSQRGNVLFLILLAVILFAALSFGVNQATRGSGKDVSEERARALAAQIVQYASLIEQTVTRLRLINGCAAEQISFENSVVSGYVNSLSPATRHCHVFDATGGGLAWQDPPRDAFEGASEQWHFTGSDCVATVGTGTGVNCWNNGNNNDNELLISLRGLKQSVCLEIARQNGFSSISYISSGGGNIFMDGRRSLDQYKWTGSWNSQTPTQGGVHYNNGIEGQPSTCYLKGTESGDRYGFYHTLIAR